MTKHEKNRGDGILGKVERLGNKIPHTMVLFLGLVALVLVLSCLFSVAGITAVDPQTGETVAVVNLLSIDGLLLILTKLVSNFATFPILGVTLVVGIAMGLCEQSGFFSAMVKYSFSKIKPAWVTLFVSFLGVFMCSFDGAVSHVVVPTLAASIYLAIGKNPLVGVISGYAAAATGAAMEFVPAFWQVALTPLTIQYAQIIDPSFTMPLMSDTFAMLPSSILAVIINAVVTIRIIEPRFGPYQPNGQIVAEGDNTLNDEQKKAVKSALLGVAIFMGILVVACIPQNSFFRGPSGSLVIDAPLMSAFENLLFFLFLIPGLIYAIKTKQARNTKDLVHMLEKGLEGLLSFIVLVLVISQFLALFNSSNLAKVIALLGGEALTGLHVAPVLIVIIVFVAYAIINLFIVSGSTKFMVFGSIVVPMLMRLNFHPAFTQFMLRLADGTTNQVSPLNPFFPVVISLCNKYDEKSGVGTALSALLVYAVWNVIGFLLMVLIFYFLQLPLGLGGASVWLH